MKRIFVINGEAGCGKDTFVQLCQSIVYDSNAIWNFSMVDKVKEIAKMCGWDGQKTPKSRAFLSDLKDLCDKYNQMSRISAKDKIEAFMNDPNAEILFIHAREPKDIEHLKEEFKAETILIKRVGYETQASNHADANVYDYVYDYEIENPGANLFDYWKVADSFLTKIGYFSAECTY